METEYASTLVQKFYCKKGSVERDNEQSRIEKTLNFQLRRSTVP